MTGKELKKRLKMTGKTLVEISQLLGMSSQALNQILNAQDVKSGTIETLADVLQIPIADLYGTPSVDVFTLSFFLIGMNIGDLLELPVNADEGGRITYNRKKTHRLYSIRVEPEAKAIIDRHRGTLHLLDVADGCRSYRRFAARLNANLQSIMPNITTYWARHSWATIAASLDIPDDTISLALGHAGANSTTSIYIERDMRKVDAANRRVIDYVLYGRK